MAASKQGELDFLMTEEGENSEPSGVLPAGGTRLRLVAPLGAFMVLAVIACHAFSPSVDPVVPERLGSGFQAGLMSSRRRSHRGGSGIVGLSEATEEPDEADESDEDFPKADKDGCENHADCSDSKLPFCYHSECNSCSECHVCEDGVDATCGPCGEGFPTQEDGPCLPDDDADRPECIADSTSCACFQARDANFCGTCATASPPGAGCGTCDNWCQSIEPMIPEKTKAACELFVKSDSNFCDTCPNCGPCDDWCQSNVCTVTVYEHADFDGWKVTLDAGKYDHHAMTAMGVKNDHVSSLKVAPGCKATLYEHNHFAGDSGDFTEGSYDHNSMVKIFKNDIASSIKIGPMIPEKTKAACELFVKRDSNFCDTCPNCGPCDDWCQNK